MVIGWRFDFSLTLLICTRAGRGEGRVRDDIESRTQRNIAVRHTLAWRNETTLYNPNLRSGRVLENYMSLRIRSTRSRLIFRGLASRIRIAMFSWVSSSPTFGILPNVLNTNPAIVS